jgi:hypothetical protein
MEERKENLGPKGGRDNEYRCLLILTVFYMIDALNILSDFQSIYIFILRSRIGKVDISCSVSKFT